MQNKFSLIHLWDFIHGERFSQKIRYFAKWYGSGVLLGLLLAVSCILMEMDGDFIHTMKTKNTHAKILIDPGHGAIHIG